MQQPDNRNHMGFPGECDGNARQSYPQRLGTNNLTSVKMPKALVINGERALTRITVEVPLAIDQVAWHWTTPPLAIMVEVNGCVEVTVGSPFAAALVTAVDPVPLEHGGDSGKLKAHCRVLCSALLGQLVCWRALLPTTIRCRSAWPLADHVGSSARAQPTAWVLTSRRNLRQYRPAVENCAQRALAEQFRQASGQGIDSTAVAGCVASAAAPLRDWQQAGWIEPVFAQVPGPVLPQLPALTPAQRYAVEACGHGERVFGIAAARVTGSGKTEVYL